MLPNHVYTAIVSCLEKSVAGDSFLASTHFCVSLSNQKIMLLILLLGILHCHVDSHLNHGFGAHAIHLRDLCYTTFALVIRNVERDVVAFGLVVIRKASVCKCRLNLPVLNERDYVGESCQFIAFVICHFPCYSM